MEERPEGRIRAIVERRAADDGGGGRKTESPHGEEGWHDARREYGLGVGKKFVAVPEVWKIVEGTLYLNLDKGIQEK